MSLADYNTLETYDEVEEKVFYVFGGREADRMSPYERESTFQSVRRQAQSEGYRKVWMERDFYQDAYVIKARRVVRKIKPAPVISTFPTPAECERRLTKPSKVLLLLT